MDTRLRALNSLPRASQKQIDLIQRLLNDCGYGDLAKRNAYLSAKTERDIKYVDDLRKVEAIWIIDELMRYREQLWIERSKKS